MRSIGLAREGVRKPVGAAAIVLVASSGFAPSVFAQDIKAARMPTKAASVQSASASAESQILALGGVLLVGATALPPQALNPYIAPFIGKPVNSDLLRQVRLAVSAAHEDAGLGLSAIDEPFMQGAIALVRVQQMRLGKIAVGNAAGPSEVEDTLLAKVESTLPELRVGTTPDLHKLDLQLRLANLQPHRRFAVDFRPADARLQTETMTKSVEVRTQSGSSAFDTRQNQPIAARRDEPRAINPVRLPGYSKELDSASQIDARVTTNGSGSFYGRAILDNAGQVSTGRERLRVQLGHGDLFGPGRSLDVSALVSVIHPERQRQIALRYQHPLPASGTLLMLDASISRSKPGRVNEFFDIAGNSQIASLSARRLLGRSGSFEPYVEVGFEMGVHDDVVNFFGVNLGSKVGTSPMSVAVAGTWQAGTASLFGQLRARHNTGLGALDSALKYNAARFSANPNWTTLDAFAQVRRALGAGKEAVLRLQGQWTSDSLISPQQFRSGGQNFMRGLIESEMAGDSGGALAFEYWFTLGRGHRLAGLVDAAFAHRNNAVATEPVNLRAASAGLAWQWELSRGIVINVAAAKVFAAKNLPQSRKGDTRLHVLLEWAL